MNDVLQALLWSPGFLLGLVALAVCLLAWVLLRRLGRARDAASYTPLAAGDTTDLALDPAAGDSDGSAPHLLDLRAPPRRADLRRAFRRVDELTASADGGRRPWFLALGAAGAGRSTLLAHSDLRLPFGEPRPVAPGDPPPACELWIFDRAVVVDVAGDRVLPESGVATDSGDWTGMLRALAAERPRRPADGIVLTLAMNELIAAADGDATALRLLGRRADRLGRRLAEAQRLLGFELPVTVVLTKADLLPGFPDLQATLPAPARRQIFGWSNPYPPATAYAGSWPDDAVDRLRDAVADEQARVLAGGLPLADPRAYLALPATLDALREPLRTCLNRIFAGGPAPDVPPLRGVYLTAGVGFPGPHRRESDRAALGEPQPPAPGTAGDGHRRVDFVADLLPERVFADWDLARPEPERREHRERVRTLARAALVVLLVAGPLLLLLNAVHQKNEVETLRDAFVVPAERAIGDCAARGGTAARDVTTACVPETLSLLDAAAVVHDYRLRPASCVGDLTECTRRLAVLAYDRVAFPTLYLALDGRVDRIVGQPVPTQTGVVYDLASVEAYTALLATMTNLDELETQAGTYNRFVGADTCWSSTRETVTKFSSLSRYLLDRPLAPPTGTATDFYGQILCDTRPTAYDPRARVVTLDARIETLSATMFRDLYTRNALVVDLAALEAGIRRLAENPPAAAEAEPFYRRLVATIDRTQEDLADPRLAWAGEPEPKFGSAYEGLLSSIATSRWTGIDTAREVHAQARRGLTGMRQVLADAATPATGPLLARDGTQVLLRLAPNVLALRAALATILGQYLRPVGDLGWTVVPASGTYLSWQPDPLTAAADLLDGYDAFVAGQLGAFPALRPAFDRSTRDRVEREALATAARGQAFPPRPSLSGSRQVEGFLAARVSNLQAAGEPLDRLLTAFRKPASATACTPDSELPYCLAVQALGVQQVDLLDSLDRLLAARALYTPEAGGFAAWQGDGNLAWSAFDVADAKALEAYVASQRGVVTALDSRYATPILTTVPVPEGVFPAPPEPLERWQLLRSDLADYTAQAPGNPLARLEGFILDTMAAATPASCLDIEPSDTSCLPASAQGSVQPPPCDYFLASRNRLVLASAARCEGVVLARGAGAWVRLADAFGSQLAGRYPFTAAAATPATAPATGRPATPAALASFFATYDAAKPAVERSLRVDAELRDRDPASLPTPAGVTWPEPSLSAADAARVGAFLAQMDGVRGFFDPFLAAWTAAGDKPKPVPAFGLEVDLRPAPGSESGGDQVLRRTLAVDATPVAAEGPPPPAPAAAPLTWTYGSSLTLTLEWARDGWYRPQVVSASPYGRVADMQVVYDYPAPWSLLRLLQGVESCPPPVAGDGDGTEDRGGGPAGNATAPAYRPTPPLTDLRALCVTTVRQPPPAPEQPPQRWFRPSPPAPGSAPEAPTRVELFVRAAPQTAADPRVALTVPTFPAAAPQITADPAAAPEPAVPATDAPARTAALGDGPGGTAAAAGGR